MCVVHFDIPADHKDYVHRSGRTGRAGALGTVVALVPIAQKRDAAKLRKLAGIDGELREPVVAALPAGHATFKASASREGGRADRPTRRSSKGAARPKRADERFRTERPGASDERRSENVRRPARLERTEPSGRTERPAQTHQPSHEDRSARADLSAPWSSKRSEHGRAEGLNRAERRQARFGEPESTERQARAAAKTGRSAAAPGGSGRATVRSQEPAGDRTEGGPRDLDRALAGSPKVRPSGASRRKAKREALVEAGQPVAGAKKRRTGTPRPPAAKRRR